MEGSWGKSKQYYSPASSKLPSPAGSEETNNGTWERSTRLQLIGGWGEEVSSLRQYENLYTFL